MKIYEALRQKELELSRLEKEVEAALRVAARCCQKATKPTMTIPTLASSSAVNAVPRPDSVVGRQSKALAIARRQRKRHPLNKWAPDLG